MLSFLCLPGSILLNIKMPLSLYSFFSFFSLSPPFASNSWLLFHVKDLLGFALIDLLDVLHLFNYLFK